MEKRILKWSLIVPLLLLGIALILALLYLATPLILSWLAPAEDPSTLTEAMSELRNTAQAFLGGLTMVLIIISGFFAFVFVVLTIIDVIQSKTIGVWEKIFWIVALLFIAGIGFFVAVAYYFVRKKD